LINQGSVKHGEAEQGSYFEVKGRKTQREN